MKFDDRAVAATFVIEGKDDGALAGVVGPERVSLRSKPLHLHRGVPALQRSKRNRKRARGRAPVARPVDAASRPGIPSGRNALAAVSAEGVR